MSNVAIETGEQTKLQAPSLRAASFDDYEKIRALVRAHDFDLPDFEDWRALWADNPLRSRLGRNLPFGWVLETSAGEIVGTMGTAHSAYVLRGEQLISAVGRFWFVAPPFRGFALRLMAEYFSQDGVDLYINNTVAPAAIASFSQLSARIPVGDWENGSYWVTNPDAFAAYMQRKFGVALQTPEKPVSPIAISNADRCDVDESSGFDSRFDTFWSDLQRQNPETLLAERSSGALSWHFAISMRSGRLRILTASRNGGLRAYCTLVQQDHILELPALPSGETYGFRGMRLVDFQSLELERDLLPVLLDAALRLCTASGMFILEHLGCGVPKMRAVDERAPYRHKLQNWKFFYLAVDPQIDAQLRDAAFWDPSAFDGDASFE
jgi:hypothetical protein